MTPLLEVQHIALPVGSIAAPQMCCHYRPRANLAPPSYVVLRHLCVAYDMPGGVYYVWRDGASAQAVQFTVDFVRAEADKLDIHDLTWVAARLGDQFLLFDFDAEVDALPPLKFYTINGKSFSTQDVWITYERIVEQAGMCNFPTVVLRHGVSSKTVLPRQNIAMINGMIFTVMHTGHA